MPQYKPHVSTVMVTMLNQGRIFASDVPKHSLYTEKYNWNNRETKQTIFTISRINVPRCSSIALQYKHIK